MREYINANIRVIKKDLKKRTKKLSKLNSDSIEEEFKAVSYTHLTLPTKRIV